MASAVLINCFEVDPAQDERFLALWRQADDLLRTRGGYRSTRLHKAVGPQARFRWINVAELDSVETHTEGPRTQVNREGPAGGVAMRGSGSARPTRAA
jgi:hypothetical protein